MVARCGLPTQLCELRSPIRHGRDIESVATDAVASGGSRDDGRSAERQCEEVTLQPKPANEMWEVVKKSSDPAGLKEFLQMYPSSTCARAARERLHQLELNMWQAVKGRLMEPTDQEDFRQAALHLKKDFLRVFPDGDYAPAAKQLMRQLEREAQEVSNGCQHMGSWKVCSRWIDGRLVGQTCRREEPSGEVYVFCPEGVEFNILYHIKTKGRLP